MNLIGKEILLTLKLKNRGNVRLSKAIDQLILTLEDKNWKTKVEIKADRTDADQVHPNGFYFFNIYMHRTLVLILCEDDGDAMIIWVGSHDEYERVFKNNKALIRKYLKDNNWI